MLLTVASICLVFEYVFQDGDLPCLPSFSYWNISRKLTQNELAQQKLGVDREQVIKIHAFHTRMLLELSPLLKKRRSEAIAANSPISKLRSNVLLDQILTERDEIITSSLHEFLDEFQWHQLRKILMKSKFRSADQPFRDEEVLSVCVVDTKTKDILKNSLDSLTAELNRKLSDCRDNSVQEIVKSVRLLPAGATKAFVHLVGNKRFPDILIENDFPNRIIPFPPEVKSVTLLGCLVHDAEVQQAVGLSELQKSKLLAVHKAFENDSTTVTGPATAKALYDGASNKMMSVLEDSQRYAVFRIITGNKFDQNYVSILSTPEVIAYLDITPDDAKALKILAEAEANDLSQKLTEINQEYFDRICEVLPPKGRKTIQRLFEDHW